MRPVAKIQLRFRRNKEKKKKDGISFGKPLTSIAMRELNFEESMIFDMKQEKKPLLILQFLLKPDQFQKLPLIVFLKRNRG